MYSLRQIARRLQEYKSEKRESETKAKTQEERIREYLTEVPLDRQFILVKVSSNPRNHRQVLYTKPKQKDKRGEFHLDTVLVCLGWIP